MASLPPPLPHRAGRLHFEPRGSGPPPGTAPRPAGLGRAPHSSPRSPPRGRHWLRRAGRGGEPPPAGCSRRALPGPARLQQAAAAGSGPRVRGAGRGRAGRGRAAPAAAGTGTMIGVNSINSSAGRMRSRSMCSVRYGRNYRGVETFCYGWPQRSRTLKPVLYTDLVVSRLQSRRKKKPVSAGRAARRRGSAAARARTGAARISRRRAAAGPCPVPAAPGLRDIAAGHCAAAGSETSRGEDRGQSGAAGGCPPARPSRARSAVPGVAGCGAAVPFRAESRGEGGAPVGKNGLLAAGSALAVSWRRLRGVRPVCRRARWAEVAGLALGTHRRAGQERSRPSRRPGGSTRL